MGPSRAGKTTWYLRLLLPQLRRGVLLDTKGDAPLADFARRHRYVVANGEAAAISLLRSKTPPAKLYVRSYDPFSDDAEELLRLVFVGPPTTLYVDEAMHWSTKATIGRWMRLLLQSGMGRGIGVWSGSQMPVDVHNLFVTQSIHFAVFRLHLADHRQKLRGAVAEIEAAARLDRYWWLYQSPDPHSPTRLFRPVAL